MFNDESWVKTLGFEESSDKLVNESVGGSWFTAVNVVFFALFVKENSGFFRDEFRGEWLAKFLFEFFHHGESSPWRGEIDLEFLFRFGRVWVELDFVAATDFLDHFGEHVFSEAKKVIVISISHVKLATGVLRVVGLIDGLISEVFTDFKDSIKAADNKLFQVKLRSNSHVKLHVEIIVMSDKGSSSGTARNHVHHGSLHFEEFHVSEVPSDE